MSRFSCVGSERLLPVESLPGSGLPAADPSVLHRRSGRLGRFTAERTFVQQFQGTSRPSSVPLSLLKQETGGPPLAVEYPCFR